MGCTVRATATFRVGSGHERTTARGCTRSDRSPTGRDCDAACCSTPGRGRARSARGCAGEWSGRSRSTGCVAADLHPAAERARARAGADA
jgi:hypothetical protein